MVSNFFPITLPFERFQISRLPYCEDKLQELRAAHNQTHSFFRHGDFIYISPMVEPRLDVGETVTLSVHENGEVVASLVRHIVFRAFRDSQPSIVPLEFSPLSFLSTNVDFDLVRRLLPTELQGVVMFPRLIEVGVRLLETKAGPRFGVLINIRHRWVFRKTVNELIDEGYNVVGRPVLEAVTLPNLEHVLAPERNLGPVREVLGKKVLVETNEGVVEKEAGRLFLNRSRHEIGNYLAFKCGIKEANRIFAILRDEESQRVSPSFVVTNVRKMARWLSDRNYQNLDNFTFRIDREDKLGEESFALEPTRFVFGLTPGSSSESILGGLWKHGPYDRSRFDKKNLKILALFQKRNRGYATNFLAKLINGIPESQFFKKGFKDLFRLHDVSVETQEIESHEPRAYDDAIASALVRTGAAFDLAIVETFDESRGFPAAQNPYLRSKARLMTHGIPVQCVLESRLKASDPILANWLGPIALQLYAKAGGVPWVLPASQSVDREIIIGVGHTLQRRNMYAGAEQSRIVGLTTFFSGDGRYLLGQQLRSVPFDEYFYTLLDSLKISLQQISENYAWKKGDNVRLVFHVFKPLKHIEVDVVDQLVRNYSDYRIKHAFVTVAEEHPYLLFQSATPEGESYKVQLCERGQNVILDEHACLLQLRGPKHHRSKSHKFPSPVLIRIHENSSYHDLQFIAQQILDFSWASWRSFSPTMAPVTIFYSDLIARMSRELEAVPGWNPEILNTQLKNSQWFL